MKTKLELTKDQVNQLVAVEEKVLKAKFENDLKLLRTKYQFVEIDSTQVSSVKRTKKVKMTDELFKSYWEKGLDIKQIQEASGYNGAYLNKIKKRVITE